MLGTIDRHHEATPLARRPSETAGAVPDGRPREAVKTRTARVLSAAARSRRAAAPRRAAAAWRATRVRAAAARGRRAAAARCAAEAQRAAAGLD